MDAIPYQPIAVPPSYADLSRTVWRPVLPVILFGPEARAETVALVDTGALETIIPLEYWEVLNPAHVIDEVSDDLEAANGTPIVVRYATIDMAVRLGKEVHRWHAKIGFSASRHEMVLGDAGFLRYFAVTCDRANRLLSIRLTAQLPIPLMPIAPGPIARPFHSTPSIRPGRRRPRR